MLIRPNVGLNPTTPQKEAGILTDPRVSVPSAPAHRPDASAAPAPPDDPLE